MKVIDPGHIYKLQSFDGKQDNRLVFVKRCNPPEKYPGNFNAHPGTQVQEVCRALIERLRYVNNQLACNETEISIRLLRQVITLLEMRNARKKGYELPIVSLIEREPTCPKCGHIYCREHEEGI